MQTIKIENDRIRLPIEIVEKLMGKEIQIIETEDGCILKTVSNPIKKARGFLKNQAFSTLRYLENKAKDKEMEI